MFTKKVLLESATRTVMLGLLAMQANAFQFPILPRGTPIRMKTDENISSATAQAGDTVQLETLDDVKAGDMVVIPRGSFASATITQAIPKRYVGRGGKLALNVDCVRIADGGQLALRGVQNSIGGGHVGPVTTGIVVSALVFWPATPFFFFVHGKEAVIPDGHEMVVYTDSDYQVVPRIEQKQAVLPVFLHNRDVLQMKEAGFGPDAIIARIHSSPGLYDVGTDDLWKLKAAGLPENVITAMIEAPDHSYR